jgi:hypothetical protein
MVDYVSEVALPAEQEARREHFMDRLLVAARKFDAEYKQSHLQIDKWGISAAIEGYDNA